MQQLKGLYGITSERFLSLAEGDILQGIEDSCKAGLNILQYRQKTTNKISLTLLKKIQQICQENQTLFIINDDIKLAIKLEADGVHLGKEDTNISEIKTISNQKFIIGASCYNSITLAKKAQDSGASYVAFGAMFASTTKPNASTASITTIQQAKKQLSIPICAIGGINKNNIQTLTTIGCDMFAIVSDIFNQPDIYQATLVLKSRL